MSLINVKNKAAMFFIGSALILFTVIGLLLGFNIETVIKVTDPEVIEIKHLIEQDEDLEALQKIKVAPGNLDRQISAVLTSKAMDLEPIYFFFLADRVFSRNKEKAVFWFFTGTIRSYYDAFRCKDKTARSGLGYLQAFAPKTAKYVSSTKNKSQFYPAAVKALDWDEKHPSTNSPVWICKHGISAIKGKIEIYPEEDWASIRREQRDRFRKSLQK